MDMRRIEMWFNQHVANLFNWNRKTGRRYLVIGRASQPAARSHTAPSSMTGRATSRACLSHRTKVSLFVFNKHTKGAFTPDAMRRWEYQPDITDAVESQNQNSSRWLWETAHKHHSSSFLFRNRRKVLNVPLNVYCMANTVAALVTSVWRCECGRAALCWLSLIHPISIQNTTFYNMPFVSTLAKAFICVFY